MRTEEEEDERYKPLINFCFDFDVLGINCQITYFVASGMGVQEVYFSTSGGKQDFGKFCPWTSCISVLFFLHLLFSSF